MSKFVCKCVDDIFHTYDYNNIPLKEEVVAPSQLVNSDQLITIIDTY